MRWHKSEESVLLTAAYDKTVCILDVRVEDGSARTLKLSADAEQAIWSHTDPNICYICSEDGRVVSYDARKIIEGTASYFFGISSLFC